MKFPKLNYQMLKSISKSYPCPRSRTLVNPILIQNDARKVFN